MLDSVTRSNTLHVPYYPVVPANGAPQSTVAPTATASAAIPGKAKVAKLTPHLLAEIAQEVAPVVTKHTDLPLRLNGIQFAVLNDKLLHEAMLSDLRARTNIDPVVWKKAQAFAARRMAGSYSSTFLHSTQTIAFCSTTARSCNRDGLRAWMAFNLTGLAQLQCHPATHAAVNQVERLALETTAAQGPTSMRTRQAWQRADERGAWLTGQCYSVFKAVKESDFADCQTILGAHAFLRSVKAVCERRAWAQTACLLNGCKAYDVARQYQHGFADQLFADPCLLDDYMKGCTKLTYTPDPSRISLQMFKAELGQLHNTTRDPSSAE